MKTRAAPEWLADFQARFGSVIRTPLDRASGTLTATAADYDAELVADVRNAERLAVYNRQYWFRLFSVLHAAFPLTARLVGHWQFNDYAARFLEKNPPRGWDIDDVTRGFDVFFSDAVGETLALVEAVRIDAVWQRVFRSQSVTAFRPTSADAARLLDLKLEPSPAMARIDQHWPLLELRRKLRDDSGEAPVLLPTELAQRESWVLVRTDTGIIELLLERREAELIDLLCQYTVREALARLESACDPAEREALPANTQRWLARSVKLAFWITPGSTANR